MTDEVLVASYDFGVKRGTAGVYRGDTGGPWVHKFNESPPDWAASTAYTTGDTTHGPGEEYAANTTCTYLGKPYTCTTAHTSGVAFDSTMWTADNSALGPAIDISDWEFLGQYRASTSPDAALLAEDSFDITDGPSGVMTRTLASDEAEGLTITPVYWDLQATRGDATVKTFLKADRLKVGGDVSRVVSP